MMKEEPVTESRSIGNNNNIFHSAKINEKFHMLPIFGLCLTHINTTILFFML